MSCWGILVRYRFGDFELDAGRFELRCRGQSIHVEPLVFDLVVLPFANLSADVDEYFADGLTEDIITNLSRFRDLRVIAGASTLQFKRRAIDLHELRAKLDAGFFVQGSVRRGGGRVRISAQLI